MVYGTISVDNTDDYDQKAFTALLLYFWFLPDKAMARGSTAQWCRLVIVLVMTTAGITVGE